MARFRPAGRRGRGAAGRGALQRRQRADLGRHWRIAAGDAGFEQQGIEHVCELMLQPAALFGRESGDERLPTLAAKPPQRDLVCQYW
jgi:hypothetical protein